MVNGYHKMMKSRSMERATLHKKMQQEQSMRSRGYVINQDGRHISGKMWSEKNSCEISFRSAYEFAYCLKLEEDSSVIAYFMECITIPYKLNGEVRKYIPDLFVVYQDDRSCMIEIKPKTMVRNPEVQMKAIAANKFITASKIKNCSYRFVTEEEIFSTHKQYRDFVGALKYGG